MMHVSGMCTPIKNLGWDERTVIRTLCWDSMLVRHRLHISPVVIVGQQPNVPAEDINSRLTQDQLGVISRLSRVQIMPVPLLPYTELK